MNPESSALHTVLLLSMVCVCVCVCAYVCVWRVGVGSLKYGMYTVVLVRELFHFLFRAVFFSEMGFA